MCYLVIIHYDNKCWYLYRLTLPVPNYALLRSTTVYITDSCGKYDFVPRSKPRPLINQCFAAAIHFHKSHFLPWERPFNTIFAMHLNAFSRKDQSIAEVLVFNRKSNLRLHPINIQCLNFDRKCRWEESF